MTLIDDDDRNAPRREAHTAAAPAPQTAPTPVYAPQQQGILGQIATTAAGVAAGHVAGRMVMGMFGGGDSASESAPVDQSVGGAAMQTAQRSVAPQCQEYSKLFLQCMEQNGNVISTCQDYMDMMKACQQQHA